MEERREFATTQWSMVLAAGGDREALEKLCRTYWVPLYAYVRRQGYAAEDAQDLTQGFFARLLEKDSLTAVNPEKGRFRSFLLASIKHYIANERDRALAQKRGGGASRIDLEDAEARYHPEPHDAETLFERQWALTLLEHVMASLREEHVRAGKGELFEHLKGTLTGEKGTMYATIASRVGMTEGAVKVAVHRVRKRYRELLRREIAQTVASPQEVDDEIRQLFSALSV